MTAKTFTDMNFQLKLLVIITASLAVLLLLLWLFNLYIRRAGQADGEEQLGRTALVTRPIQSSRLGQISYTGSDGKKRLGLAQSDQAIAKGQTVVIVSCQSAVFTVQPTAKKEAEAVT